ncbi:MAG: hypothetical protein GXY12_09890 [Clostridiaceae bacterium]|mgnify:CR=1 FL=1|jgi:hypothetical protein|nr:hypothetical protein [Clostridiaceae bacterium]
MSLELIEKPLKTAGTKKLKPLSLIFIFELISISTNIKELREKRRLEEIRYREEQEKRWQLKQLQEKELEKLKQLETEALDWQKSSIIMNYLNELEKQLPTYSNNPEQLKQILEWIDWAKGKAEWLNPLIAKRDPILGKRYS